MARKTIKQFGLERTGSSYLFAIIKRNFDVRMADLEAGNEWKHATVSPNRLDAWDHTVVTCKDPLAWYQSTLAFFHQPREPFVPQVMYSWCAYNQYYAHLADTRPDKVTIVRYEDLMQNSREALAPFAEKAGISRLNDTWSDIAHTVHAADPVILPGYEIVTFDKSYYEDKRYLQLFTGRELDNCCEILSHHQALLDRLQYSYTLSTTLP